jgi:hypothetical protein
VVGDARIERVQERAQKSNAEVPMDLPVILESLLDFLEVRRIHPFNQSDALDLAR